MNAERKGRDDKIEGEDAPHRIETRNDWSGAVRPRKWVWKSWLGYRLTLFTGHGGSGKSRLALQLAAAVASGTSDPWIPPAHKRGGAHTVKATSLDTEGASVLVASWEDEADEVHRRLYDMAKTLPWAACDQIKNRLYFADLAGSGPLWDARQVSGTGLTEVGKELRALAKRIEAQLLIIDPRAAAYAGDENHRAQVRAFISHWDRWARENECAVLLIDHLPKSAMQTGFTSGVAYAGSTDWHNAARSVWTLDEKQVLHCDKSNYGATPDPVKLISKDGHAWIGEPARGFRSENATSSNTATNPFGAD